MSKTKRIKAKFKRKFNEDLKINKDLRIKVRNMTPTKGGCTKEVSHASKVLNKDTYYRY